MLSIFVVVLAIFLRQVQGVNPLVKLSYTSYQGTAQPNGITQWLGMRFAAPPVGQLRFSAPIDPPANSTIQIADTHGLICLGTGVNAANPSESEDCLFIDVYAPSSATSASKLPVFFFIQGGGFNADSNPNLNGTGLIEAADMDMVVVTFNYRVGPYGFLAGSQVKKGGSLNNGLKDQLKALEWVQKYIKQFGGNPNHVTIGGDSAGAASVSLLLSAYGGRDLGLFHAAAAESVSFATVLSSSESQFMYENLVIRTQCASASDTLACLRNVSAFDLQQQNYNTPFAGAQYAPLYMYSPTMDNDVIQDITYRLFAQGKFQKLPIITGSDMNDGTIFTPRSTANFSQSDTFIQAQFPFITLAQLGHINTLYPNDGLPQFNGTGAYWRQVSNAYGDMRYRCPGQYIASMASLYGGKTGIGYNYLWNVSDPTEAAEGLGVPHTIELNAIWGPDYTNGGAPASYYPGGVNAAIVPVVQGYWTSFIRSYNPNTYRLKGTPKWEQWTQDGQERMVFVTNATEVQTVGSVEKGKCNYFIGIGPSINQ